MPRSKIGSLVIAGSEKSASNGVFREIRMPDGTIALVMNRRVFQEAVDSANKTIKLQAKNYTGK